MALIVEDGSGADDSESYVSVSDASNYATKWGYPWAPTDTAAAEAALRRATSWIDAHYRIYFPGEKINGRTQSLEWPRKDAYDASGDAIDSTSVPIEIQRATAEAAVVELQQPNALSPVVTSGRVIKSATVSGAVSVTYSDEGGVVAGQRPVVTSIDDILGGLFPVTATGQTSIVYLRRA